MPDNAISWWLREPAYLLWGDRAVVNKLLVGKLSTVGISAGVFDKLGRGINWKWGKVWNEKRYFFTGPIMACAILVTASWGSQEFR